VPQGPGPPEPLSHEAVEAALRELYVTAEGSPLRPEERKKVPEVASMLTVLRRLKKDPLLVDAAAGRGYVGLLAAKLLGVRRVVTLERDPERVALVRRLARGIPEADFDVREGGVEDRPLWPASPDVVAALHACGPASDAVLEAAIAQRAKWLLLVPCCYADTVPFAARARALADEVGVPRQSGVRRRFVESVIDSQRTLRLEAAGYEVKVSAFVSPTITPHNLLWRARRIGPTRWSTAAREKLARLEGTAPSGR